MIRPLPRSALATALLAAAVAAPGAARAAVCGAGTTACGGSTSVTYNGSAMTLYGASTNGTVRTELWYMVAPASGAHNVVVTAPSALSVTATSMSFTGVHQTTPLGTAGTAIGTSTTPSVSRTAAVGEGIFDVVGAVGTTAPTVAGAAQTLRQSNTTATGVGRVVIGSSTAHGTGSAVTMSWTIPSADWAQIAVPVRASTAQTAVRVEGLIAAWQADHVLVSWRAGYTPESLGYNVLRADAGGDRVKLNADLIRSGALQEGQSSFSWTDESPGWDGSVSYWIEDVAVDGSSTLYGPAAPMAGGGPGFDAGAFPGSDASAGGGLADRQTGCAFGDASGGRLLLNVFIVLGLFATRVRGRQRWLLLGLYVSVGLATALVGPRQAAGAGGISVDATATGTGASGLTFSHTMGTGANGLLLVGVVVPIQCNTTTTDGGNCSACGVTCPLYTTSAVDSGLIGNWHFNEGSGTTSADSSGSGATASLLGLPAWVAGYTGYGVMTDGSSSYVQASFGTWFGGNNTLTAAAWVYVTSTTNGPVFGVSTIPGGGGWNMPFLSVDGSTATVYGWMWGMTTLSTTVTLNAWHHLAITYTPTGGSPGREIFYVDGTAISNATGTFSSSGLTSYFTTYIPGAKPTGVNSTLLGKIDEARAYNRVLSAAEISSLATARRNCAASSCAACPMSLTSCAGLCTSTSTDNINCGTCGHACNTTGGESCMSGTCGCSSGTDCSTMCVDTTTDPNNCGGCGTVCGTPTTSGIDTGLLGRWHMDEGTGATTADSSGNGRTATLTNSPTWSTGYSSYGLTFNGTNNYLNANLGTWYGANNTLTATAWVYATTTTNGPIFGVTDTPPGGGWNMPFLSIAGSTVYGWLWMVNSNTPLSATVSLNAWHFLAITYSPTAGEKFYVDGTLSASGTGTYSPSGTTDYLTTYIPGAKPSGVNSYLNGLVDEVRAYDRVLSANEITLLYNARQTCSSSTCGGCTGGGVLCSGACTIRSIDDYNCGSCGNVCNIAGGQTCISSSCGCLTGTNCSGTCTNTTTDQNNCGSCGNVCAAVTCGSCDNRMAGNWHLSEGSGTTSADSSGSGNTITLTSGPTWTTGSSGNGLSFDGIDDRISATLGTTFGTNNAISASAWVYATSTTNGPIFGVTQTLPGTNWNMPFLSISGSTVYGWLWQVNGNTPLSTTVTLNAWHMLTITYDPSGAGTESFYVDGALVSSGTGTYSPAGATVFLTTYISGAKPAGVNSYFTGRLDELRAYNRLLTAGEVALLYNARQACTASSCSGCPSGTTSCTGVCTNRLWDNNNCNACGTVCPGAQTCVNGTCM